MEVATNKNQPSRKSPIDKAVVLLIIGATLLIVWLSFSNRTFWGAHWPSYGDMVSLLPEPSAWLRWVLGDISEVAFYKHEFASIGLLAGAYLAYWANRTGNPGKDLPSPMERGFGPGWSPVRCSGCC